MSSPVDGFSVNGREHRLDARVVAVGVVGVGDLAELGDRAGQVGRVLAQRVHEVLRSVKGPDGAREHGRGQLLEPRQPRHEVGQVVAGPGDADELTQGANGGRRLRGQVLELLEQRGQAFGGGLGLVHQHVQVVQRGAQVHERGVALAQRGGGQLERLAQRLALVRDRTRGGVGIADQRRQVPAALRDGPHGPRRVHQETVEGDVVGHELARQGRRGVQSRRGVLQRLRVLLRAAAEVGGLALDHVLQALARLGVQRVEQLVEVHRRAGGVGRDLPAAGDLRAVVGPGRERHVAVGDARQRVAADGGGGPAVQVAKALSSVMSTTACDCRSA